MGADIVLYQRKFSYQIDFFEEDVGLNFLWRITHRLTLHIIALTPCSWQISVKAPWSPQKSSRSAFISTTAFITRSCGYFHCILLRTFRLWIVSVYFARFMLFSSREWTMCRNRKCESSCLHTDNYLIHIDDIQCHKSDSTLFFSSPNCFFSFHPNQWYDSSDIPGDRGRSKSPRFWVLYGRIYEIKFLLLEMLCAFGISYILLGKLACRTEIVIWYMRKATLHCAIANVIENKKAGTL